MKVFQLIRDVLLGLLALLLLLALLPVSASAQPLYHTLAGHGTTQQRLSSLRLSPSLADASPLALFPSGMGNADGYRRLARATTADFSEMPVKPATQANLEVSLDASHGAVGGCHSIPGFSGCGNQPHSAKPAGSSASFLPDPSPWLMLLLGFVGIMLLRRQM